MIDPFNIYAPDGDVNSGPVILLEAPHTSTFVPAYAAHPILKERLESHEGHDPGALSLAKYLHLQFKANAWLVTSNRSRLFIEHNRTLAYCCPEGVVGDERKRRLDEHYYPYINTVFKLIERFIKQKRFPIYLSIHTYASKKVGKSSFEKEGNERKLFSVLGDRDAVLVKAFVKHLREQVSSLENQKRLRALGLSSDNNFSDHVVINDPYSLDPIDHAKGKENSMSDISMVPSYPAKYGFPFISLAVLNTMAAQPAIQRLVAAATREVFNDPAVTRDWSERCEAFFRPKNTRGNKKAGDWRHRL